MVGPTYSPNSSKSSDPPSSKQVKSPRPFFGLKSSTTTKKKISEPLQVKEFKSKKKPKPPIKEEFNKVRQLDDEDIQHLNKARCDLSQSIDRTLRIQQAFIRKLQKQAKYSDRVKHIINSVELIKFHCEVQQQIITETITEILDSKEKAHKRLLEIKRKEEREYRKRLCISCDFD